MEFGRGRNLINGEWVNSNSKEILEVRNPALDEVIAEVHQTIQRAGGLPRREIHASACQGKVPFQIKGNSGGKLRRIIHCADKGTRKKTMNREAKQGVA